ncbi:MAG TPA: GDSL-type esterase/lipase family protein [Myxococcota bacterium]|nr:GDSL-type esterase/lipase family protein [Myxococcota bacterium]
MLRDERIDWGTIGPALAGVLRVAVVAGFTGLAVAEVALRLAGLPTGAAHRARDAYDLDDEVPGPYRPGARIDLAWPPETAYLATFNSWGMRGAEPRRVDAARILALGDSQTFGLGVQDDETWPARLDRNLAAAGHPHPVLNLASPHLLIDDEIRYLEEVLPRYHPAVVVWMLPSFGFPANEVASAQTPHQRSLARERRSRERWAGFVSASALSEARDWSFVWRDRVARAARGEVLAAPPLVANDDEPAQQPGKDHFLAKLPALEQLVSGAGARLLLVPHPQIAVVDGHVRLAPPWVAQVASERGIAAVDLYADFRADPDPDPLFQLPWDTHPSPLAHERIARAVQAELERRGWLE